MKTRERAVLVGEASIDPGHSESVEYRKRVEYRHEYRCGAVASGGSRGRAARPRGRWTVPCAKWSTVTDLFPKPALNVCSFSPCLRYRYSLTHGWDPTRTGCAFICLNPSTASEVQHDPTVRRCIGYSKRWGYGSFTMLNLFGYRCTDPFDMKLVNDPVGPGNDEAIVRLARSAAIVVAGWGTHGTYLGRSDAVRALLRRSGVQLHALALTKGGEPRHPLYLRADLEPFRLEDQ
jgi:hypothetical protein